MSEEEDELEVAPIHATSDIWSNTDDATTYREEVREHAGLTFKVTRRSLTYPEEMRIAARVVDPKTRMPDTIELLAQTVRLAVKENSFGLTPDIVRKELPQRAALAAFLVNWLCLETMTNWAPGAVEDIRKKRGP